MKSRSRVMVILLSLNFIVKTAPSYSTSKFVNFNVSMKRQSKNYQKKFKNPRKRRCLAYLERLYAKNNFLKVVPSAQPKIPKIIHQIWVGGKPLPKKYYALIESWKAHHPGWKYILWTDDKAKKFKLQNRKFYDKTQDPIEKANILRYEVLRKYGGVYADIDFHCLKPFDELNHLYHFYTGICPADCLAILNNALIGCTPNHPIINHCINTVKRDFHKRSRFLRTGVHHYGNSFFRIAPHSPGVTVALPPSYFYPVPKNYNPQSHNLHTYLRPESFAVHYWANQYNGNHNTAHI